MLKATTFVKIGKWGTNPSVRFNEDALSETDISMNDKVKVEYHKDKIVIKKVK